jgi:hypothetical protein
MALPRNQDDSMYNFEELGVPVWSYAVVLRWVPKSGDSTCLLTEDEGISWTGSTKRRIIDPELNKKEKNLSGILLHTI